MSCPNELKRSKGKLRVPSKKQAIELLLMVMDDVKNQYDSSLEQVGTWWETRDENNWEAIYRQLTRVMEYVEAKKNN